MAAAGSSSHVDPLTHPLFANGISAATRGSYTHAFRGIAALIDEEQEDEDGSQDEDDQPTQPHRANSAPTTSSAEPPPFTWTRPSAIRIARMKAEAAERAQRGEQTQSRSQHRTVPYQRRSRGTTASERTSPQRTPGSSSTHQPDHEMTDDTPATADSISSYGAIRSHARKRAKNSASVMPSRMSVRTSSELATERAEARKEAATAGETTMLLHMWKM